jgi:hypothetical protein
MLMYVALGLPLFLNPDNTFGIVMTKEESSWFGELCPWRSLDDLLSDFSGGILKV